MIYLLENKAVQLDVSLSRTMTIYPPGFDHAKGEVITDEIKNFVSGRYFSASEAAWRMFEYEITRRDPAVTSLVVHLEDQNFVTFENEGIQQAKEKISELERYFLRPTGTEFDNLAYAEYFKINQVSKVAPKTAPQTWFDEAKPPHQKIVYKRMTKHITRLDNVKVQSGERWYLRILLRHVPARSYTALRTVSTKQCSGMLVYKTRFTIHF